MSDTPKQILRIDFKGLDQLTKTRFERLKGVIEVSSKNGCALDMDLRGQGHPERELEAIDKIAIELVQSELPEEVGAKQEEIDLENVAELDKVLRRLEAKSGKRSLETMEEIFTICTKNGVEISIEVMKQMVEHLT